MSLIENAPGERGVLARHSKWALLLPPLLAVLVHWPALSADLFWDDSALITSHPQIADPRFITEIFGRDFGFELAQRSPVGYYRPLLLAIDYGIFHLFGPSPFAFHLAVLLTFSFACWLVAAVSNRALGGLSPWAAVLIGCLTAVHPVRTEYAVFFMSMPNVLIEIFALGILATCLGFVGRASPPWQVAFVAMLALGAGISHEMAFFVIGALAATRLISAMRAQDRRAAIFQSVGMMSGLAAAYLMRLAAGVSSPLSNSPRAPLGIVGGRAWDGLLEGLRNLLVPSHTVFLDPGGDISGLAFLALVIALAVFAAILIIRLALRGKLFEAMVGAWFAAGLFGLMLLRSQGAPFASRYVPSSAGIIILVLLARRLWQLGPRNSPAWRWLGATIAAIYLATLAAFAWTSTIRCRNTARFFAAMADQSPDFYYPRVILANILLLRADNFKLASKYVNDAIAAAPNEPRVRSLGKTLGAYYIAHGEYGKGLEALDWGGEVLTGDAELWSLRAKCQLGLEDYSGALKSVRHALMLAPGNPDYRRQLEEISAAATGD